MRSTASAMRAWRRTRRGALLLIVLILLVLLLLIGTTMLVTARSYQRSAIAFSRHEWHGTDPRQELDSAIYSLLRGPASSPSALYGHSLLEDLYGDESIKGVIGKVQIDPTSGMLILEVASSESPLSSLPYFYSGAVFTILSGPAQGISQRIVSDTPGRFVVEPFGDAQAVPRPGDRFLLNGRPFNGTGGGFDPQTGQLNASFQFASGEKMHDLPLALLPNVQHQATGLTPKVALHAGGADETWDAADYQNLFLAFPSDGIPSFHRPALIEYWRTHDPDLWKDPRFRRLVVLRPLPEDHASFTGGNPAMGAGDSLGDHLVNGPWDVDNDNDGDADSVWIDLDYPVQSAEDGRLYKPLFAFLCVDLDGRINVNAHGNSRHLQSPDTAARDIPLAGEPPLDGLKLPTGRGYGPADVSLDPIFGKEASQLLSGNSTVVGRYGPDKQPGKDGMAVTLAAIDPLVAQPQLGSSLFLPSTDLFGLTQVALDPSGRPLTFSNTPTTENLVNHPYGVNLVRADFRDSLFSLGEMERVLRIYDTDTLSLPNRLLQLARNTIANSYTQGKTNLGNVITTRSAYLPSPPDLNVTAGSKRAQLMEVLAAKLKASGVPDDQLTRQIQQILAPELLLGRRINLNRPFGNGVDDNRNRVVDEPSECQLGELAWGPSRQDLPEAYRSIRFHHLNDDPLIQTPRYARQIAARHLYCLAMLLTDDEGSADSAERTAQRLAQWAINVVDFRDPDAIMTPFEFDLNPLDGWQTMDGDPATDEGGQRRLVWGCEYPELIVTETIAWHDRRVRDTEDDDGVESRRVGEDAKEGDPDLDQHQIPQGSLFVELYCTRSRFHGQSHETFPAELYNDQQQLELAKLAPASKDGHRYPVWQLIVSRKHPQHEMRRDANVSLEPTDDESQRVMWFVSQLPSDMPGHDKIYFNHSQQATVDAGEFVVLGPRLRRDVDREQTIVLAAEPPKNWTHSELTAPSGIGISVSEPLPQQNYYREPTQFGPDRIMDRYAKPLPDKPFDNVVDRPLTQDKLPSFGTVTDYRGLYVQRLANPLEPFDPSRNPYLTVDWATIDLTIFNSADQRPAVFPPELGQFDPPGAPAAALELRFGSRERGGFDFNIWDPNMPQPEAKDVAADERFAEQPQHTLGGLSSRMALVQSEENASTPFPWLVWQNEPLVSPIDLMLVPLSSPSRLPQEFKLGAHFGPIGHLPSFFDKANDRLGKLHRLLDYVEVPTRFVGARRWYDPVAAEKSPNLAFRRPPANWCSVFRDAGRININTIRDPLVWHCIAKGFPAQDSDAFFEKIVRSRQGFGGLPASQFPTRYANPFRAAASADLMPLPQLKRRGVEATLLRTDPDDQQFQLFSVNSATHPEVLEPYRNQNRNAYFYYQGLQRLGNLLSTNSNVFAVWITVGYFRVEPRDDPQQPYSLAEEMNVETGETRRHRAFYVIDRSVPVGFEPGENHNVQHTIVLRRFIE